MSWFKVDDKFFMHPKVAGISHKLIGIWTVFGSYCASYETDGVITQSILRQFSVRKNDAEQLVEAGLWERCGDDYRFHDWQKYQPTSTSAEKRREYEREKKRKQRQRPEGTKRECPEPVPTMSPGDTVSLPDPTLTKPQKIKNTPPNPLKGDDRVSTSLDLVSCEISSEVVKAPKPERRRVPYSAAFEQFWESYPRKTAKGAAWKAWKTALKSTEPDKILAAVHSYALDPNLPSEGRFIPHPATWLNGRRFDDPPLASSRPATSLDRWRATATQSANEIWQEINTPVPELGAS